MSNANSSHTLLHIERLLPPPNKDATTLVRLVTTPLAIVPDAKDKDAVKLDTQPTVWLLDRAHPLAGYAKILRMYHREDGGVDVYSSDGQMFVRTYIAEHCILFFDESMNEDTMVAFVEAAESDEEDEEEEEEETETETEQPTVPTAANAPPTSAS